MRVKEQTLQQSGVKMLVGQGKVGQCVKFSVKLSFSDNVGHWKAIKFLKVRLNFVKYPNDVHHLDFPFIITRGHLLLFSEIDKNNNNNKANH